MPTRRCRSFVWWSFSSASCSVSTVRGVWIRGESPPPLLLLSSSDDRAAVGGGAPRGGGGGGTKSPSALR